MSWQDELRRLDDELAGGRLTHEVHRKMRDELLASVSGGSAASPVVSPLRRPTALPPQQQWQSTYPQLPTPPHQPPPVQQPPAPVAQQPPTPPVPAPEPPRSRRVTSSAELLSTTRQTTAPSPADQRATDSMVFPRRAAGNPLQPQPTRPAALPPLAPAKNGSAPAYLPDNPFPTLRKNHRLPMWLFLALGVLLVLAMIIGGSLWLGSGSDTPVAAPPPTPTASGAPAPVQNTSTTQPPPTSLEDRLPKLPGTASNDNSTMSLAKGSELKLYSPEAGTFFASKGATEVVYEGSTDGTSGYLILVVPAKNPDDAAAIIQYLRTNSLNGGLQAGKIGDVDAVTGQNANGKLSGTGYASGNFAVTAWVSENLGGSAATLAEHLQQTVAQLRQALPPN